jgi:hypothetical protein
VRLRETGFLSDDQFSEIKNMKTLTGIVGIVLVCLGAALAVSLRTSTVAQSQFSGQWIIEFNSFKTHPGLVQLSLQYETERGGRGNHSHLIAREQLQGLSDAQAMSSGGAVQFQIKRDAGAFNCEGWFRAGNGSGHFVFAGNPSYVSELRRQGYGTPTDEQLFRLGLSDVGYALLEELRSQGYERSSIDQLVRVGDHGVTINYIREIGALGYRVGQVEKLIRMRDHGVTPDFIRGLQAQGYRELSAEDLVRARDHGVTPDFVREIRDLGYSNLSLENFVRMRDHGVTPDFVKGIKQAGFDNISAEELVRCRDHGVTPEYIQKLRSSGVQNLTIDQIIRLRDHGIDG